MAPATASASDQPRKRGDRHRDHEFRSRWLRLGIFALAALNLAACGPKKFSDLPTPYFGASFQEGYCSSSVVVDGSRRVWSESGCEAASSGLIQGATVASSRFDWLTTQFNDLPPPKPLDFTSPGPPDGGVRDGGLVDGGGTERRRSVVLFSRTADRVDEWFVDSHSDAAAPPYGALIQFFTSLPTTPGQEIL